MWRLKIGAKGGDETHLFTTNNYTGRQTWEFDADACSPEELAEVDEARQNFSINRSRFKISADLLWRMQVSFNFNMHDDNEKVRDLISWETLPC